MRLFVLTALTMVAFAANSVLNRFALADGAMGPASFAAVRLLAGAAVLAALVAARRAARPRLGARTVAGVLGLSAYMLGFSYAYVTLDTGVGALILFGGVQVALFAAALALGERVGPARWLGMAIALAGLAVLLWPAGTLRPDVLGAGLMATAALGWSVYTLAGRGETDPLGATAVNFVLAAPLGVLAALLWPDGASVRGVVLAAVSGGATSGLGYALWYHVLPRLETTVAAVAQLTAPVIAAAGGIALLGEPLTLRFALATLSVLGGVALTVVAPSRPGRSSG